MRTRFQTSAQTCIVCLGQIELRGVLDCCSHPLCFACAQHWAMVRTPHLDKKHMSCLQAGVCVDLKGAAAEGVRTRAGA